LHYCEYLTGCRQVEHIQLQCVSSTADVLALQCWRGLVVNMLILFSKVAVQRVWLLLGLLLRTGELFWYLPNHQGRIIESDQP